MSFHGAVWARAPSFHGVALATPCFHGSGERRHRVTTVLTNRRHSSGEQVAAVAALDVIGADVRWARDTIGQWAHEKPSSAISLRHNSAFLQWLRPLAPRKSTLAVLSDNLAVVSNTQNKRAAAGVGHARQLCGQV
jgi:hypothetical protein